MTKKVKEMIAEYENAKHSLEKFYWASKIVEELRGGRNE